MPRPPSPSVRLVSTVGIIAIAATLSGGIATAATIRGDDRVSVPAGETLSDNLYAFGDQVRVDGTLEGDLVAFGREVIIGPDGLVTGDVLAAASRVAVEGRVEGDVRSAASVVQAESGSAVGGDFVGAAMSVGVASGADIGGDFIGAGYQGLVDGRVAGDVRFAGTGLSIEGSVEGDVHAHVDEPKSGPSVAGILRSAGGGPVPARDVPGGLEVADGAIGGTLVYTSPVRSEVADAAALGGVTFEPALSEGAGDEDVADTAGDIAVSMARRFAVLFLFGVVVLALAPRVAAASGASLGANPMASAGYGCLTLLVALVGTIALAGAFVFSAIVLGLLGLGPLVAPALSATALGTVALTFGVHLLAWVGRVVTGLWLGRALLGQRAPVAGGLRGQLLPVSVGLLLYAVAAGLPLVGPWLDFVGIVLGLGAIALSAKDQWRFQQAERAAAPA